MSRRESTPGEKLRSVLAGILTATVGSVALAGCAGVEAPKTVQAEPVKEKDPVPRPEPTPTSSRVEPFSRTLMDKLDKEPVAQFKMYNEQDRLQFILGEMFDETYKLSECADRLNQEVPGGRKLYDYSPYENPLSADSPAQDILWQLLHNEAFMMAQNQASDQHKFISSIVRGPSSAEYADYEQAVNALNGPKKLAGSELESEDYRALEEEVFIKLDAGGVEETYRRIASKKNVRTFVFVSVENLNKASRSRSDDSDSNNSKFGIWLLTDIRPLIDQ